MRSITDALNAAAGDGLITPDQANRLAPYFQQTADAVARPAEDGLIAEDSEQPRFVRGFHDILITIGVLIVLTGASGLGGPFASLPLIVALAEVLIRRQRLALPAVVITIALVYWTATLSVVFLGDYLEGQPGLLAALAMLAPVPLVVGLFYWRYRVPLALALAVVSLAGCFVLGVLVLIGKVLGANVIFETHPHLVSAVFLVVAFGLFALAMRYDVSDPLRQTRRSDIAFWLHLVTAPALLYAMLSLILLRQFTQPVFEMPTGYAAVVMVIVAAFMLLGLIIDRRAFVTSGLISLGFAIFALINRSGFQGVEYGFTTLLAVGVVVLAIGIFWVRLRRLVMRPMPSAIARRLHPAF
ncbi:hypothetical protein [Pararhizobium antarcticum]|uniref:DUF2157 domain-containing protein n=1 Tax=Pararhizobium antarcticum TaxID=1798805 RepID=A0A657LTF4_9HYPH|nr:hypothetical protein [Pararhizobium antarcticum]OJF96824.1 hypothetical protein AX760_02865 [Pararhizobium antarcticum]OJF98998.1 hypothetical protein AX761_12310 [Rhizobium sp. 58]